MTDTVEARGERAGTNRSTRGRRIMALVIIILILLLGLSTYLLLSLTLVSRKDVGGVRSPGAKELTWVRSIYGTSNRAVDLFGQTQAGVPGSDGSIWVTDVKSRALMHFTADGGFLGSLRSADASLPLQMPSRLAVGPDGLIYVCETTLDTVRVLRADGSEAGSFGIPQPVSVAVSADHVAVGSVHGFAILEKSGKPVKVFGSRGKGEDQFDYVHGIAFDGAGNVYVADSYNNRLSAYDRNGKRLWMLRTGAPSNSASYKGGMLTPAETTGTDLVGRDALQLPLGLTVDGAGRVVVSDMYDCSLAVFESKTGKFVGKFGDVGANDGQFFYPVSVSYDPSHDWFTVADAFNKRIQIVRLPGSSSGAASGLSAAARRGMEGPLRACFFPLLLLLIAIAVGIVEHFRRKRRDARTTEPAVAGGDTGTTDAVV